MVIVMAHSSHRKEGQCQQHEDQSLDEADEQLKPIEDAGQEECDEKCHHQQDDFTGKDVSKETKREADYLGDFGDQLEEANHSLHWPLERILEELSEVGQTQCLDTVKLGHKYGD